MDCLLIINFFVPIIFANKISPKIPDQVKDLCTHLGELNVFMRNLWTINKNYKRPTKSYRIRKRSNNDNQIKNKIIAGGEAKKDQFPFMIGIHFN